MTASSVGAIHRDSGPKPADAAQSETTPLLPDGEGQGQAPREITPLPKGQLTIICFIRLMDPINFSQLFPYINEYIVFLKVTDHSQVGFYSGVVDSAFATAQFISLYLWSSWSDKIGRRPVIIVGSIGVALSTIAFGVSGTFSGLMIFRALAGVFGGATSVVQSVLGEVSDKSNEASAFALYGVMWPIGCVLGPLIGGLFSTPATRVEVLKGTLFEKYPYLLPGLVCGILQLLATLIVYIAMKETLPAKRSEKGRDYRHHEEDEIASSDTIPTSNLGFKELLSLSIIRNLTAGGFALDFSGTSYSIVFALFCFSPIESGGLAFSASTIGYILSSTGILGGLAQVLVLPPLLRRFEAGSLFTASMAGWPCAFALLPFLNMIAVRGLEKSGDSLRNSYTILLWFGIALAMILSRIGALSYSLLMLLTKSNVPDPAVLGATNGLVLCSMCLARSISAIFASVAFAYSQKHHVLGGYFWAVVLAGSGMLGVISSHRTAKRTRSTLQ